MVMVPGREMTDEELLEARGQSSGMQRESTLDALNAMAAAAPQAAPAPPPEPINVPPMLERPTGTIPEALARPSGEVIHPRDQALIDRFKRFQQTTLPAQEQARMVVPEMLKRMPEVQAPRTAEGMVLEKFGGSMAAYNKWWHSLPQGMKPRSWDQALGMVSSPEALGVPKAAPKVAPAPQVAKAETSRPEEFVGPPAPEVQKAVERNPEAFFHPLGNAPDNAVWEVSSSVGKRVHPITKEKGKLHKGTDFRAKTGTPLLAMQSGTVTYNRTGGDAGNRIEITYDNGAVVKYFHMDKRSKLKVGAKVKPGKVVGAVGTSGRVSGPHLHAELRIKNPKTGKFELHDLEKYLKAKGSPASYGDTLYTEKHSKHDGHNH